MNMNLREQLKRFLPMLPEERKTTLSKFIDDEMLDNDLSNVVNFMTKLNSVAEHKITILKYSVCFELFIVAESGMTFIR